MRFEHATLDGHVIVTEVPDEPLSCEPIEIAVPSLTSLAAALQVIAERVGMTKAEAETLVRQPRAIASADEHR
jgi:hypothetical protein